VQIQVSAPDPLKVAMLNVCRRLRPDRREARLVLRVHDELELEVLGDEQKPSWRGGMAPRLINGPRPVGYSRPRRGAQSVMY
jgi:hypothetical protein